jgi:DNA helicase-2/ATP-dependent DNA helicase PcrA
MEEKLFPHSRSFDSEAAMEEERRLCYVGMTRAEKRLYLTWARARRRFGGGELEPSLPSRFLKEVPRDLVEKFGESGRRVPQVDLFSERHEVRETVKRNLYTGKTVNSIDNIGQFFAERGVKTPSMVPQPPAPASAKPATPQVTAPVGPTTHRPPPTTRRSSTIVHPKYGRGTVLRREGDGDDAKLTVSFPGYGLKKLMEKYAGIKEE